ncbi:sensor histidine kinase [Sphingomonas flavalba]|uniref:sensor histidine kinase n=1 Tax=Sphingomonas flavalba TaxID=2559804 RepID=UPI0039E0265F
MAQPPADAAARIAMWCQLVDLVAQTAGDDSLSCLDDAYAMLREWRADVPRDRRHAAAAALAGRRVPARLVTFFAEDDAAITAPVIGGARLTDADWVALVPRLSPVARALLRHRRDLGAAVGRALASYGATDFVLPGAIAPATPPAQIVPIDTATPSTAAFAGSELAELVARIEAFRRDRRPPEPQPETAAALPDCHAFTFETDTDGAISFCGGAPRAQLVGLSIADTGEGDHGVDGHAAGAFRRRAPFRDARLRVPGEAGAAGDWRISAVPCFDPRAGRFLGFRGSARRPRADERAETAGHGLHGSTLGGESLRQLVHEIRTPLNAIIGFAEMIDQQVLGPAAADYRGRAGAILGDARRLLDTVDDLDVAARVESAQRQASAHDGSSDIAARIAAIGAELDQLTETRGVALALRIAPGLAPIAVDQAPLDRMVSRLLAATVGLATEGERIAATVDVDSADRARICLSVDRPAAIAGQGERALLDPGYSPDGDWPDAPTLGLGFTLRLVRNLAEAAGGRLDIAADRFVLTLPTVTREVVEREDRG